jgi:hypothetical protein
MADATNLVLLAKLDIRDALNHKLLMADYSVPKALLERERNNYPLSLVPRLLTGTARMRVS